MKLRSELETPEGRALTVSRVFDKVKVNVETGCWEWQGLKDVGGYGSIGVGGRHWKVHRLNWQMFNGQPVPEGMLVCHRCDNPPCCNPDHLFVGTHADNNADKVAKGRQARGEDTAKSKLTDDKVREIFRLAHEGRAWRSIARGLGLDTVTIRQVLLGRTWGHLGLEPFTREPWSRPGTSKYAPKLTDDQVREIRARRAAGELCVPLAKEFGVTHRAILLVAKHKSYKHVN